MILFLNLTNLNGFGKNLFQDQSKHLLKVHKSLNFQLIKVNLKNSPKPNKTLIRSNLLL